ncbi:MAG: hypothetical protein NTW63_02085 [Caldiserica bacterium]|nr:hypothetical protein [Caldisericota bacterium]
MRARVTSGTVLLVAFVLIAGCVSVVRAQPVETAVPEDARIQQLVDLHVLLGAPDGDLQLERQANGGEFVVLLERVLKQPQLASQSLGTPSEGGEANGWIRAYAWTRRMWDRVLDVRTQVGHRAQSLDVRLVARRLPRRRADRPFVPAQTADEWQ